MTSIRLCLEDKKIYTSYLSNRAVGSIMSTLFFPVVPYLLQLVCLALFCVVAVLLASAGKAEYRLMCSIDDCECNGIKVSMYTHQQKCCHLTEHFLKLGVHWIVNQSTRHSNLPLMWSKSGSWFGTTFAGGCMHNKKLSLQQGAVFYTEYSDTSVVPFCNPLKE